MVRLTGYADRDVQRGASFEQRISLERARAIAQGLRRLVGRGAARITWQAGGRRSDRFGCAEPTERSRTGAKQACRNRAVNRVASCFNGFAPSGSGSI